MDVIQSTAAQNGTLNAVTGTVGKAFDTFLDALAIGAANKVVGTDYPTGQESPEKIAAKLKAEADARAAMSPAFNWKPWAIGGGAVVALVLVLAVIAPRSK